MIRVTGVLALALLALFSSPAGAATETGDSRALIVTPLRLVYDQPLSFGNLIPSAAAGTATIDPFTGVRTVTGGVTMAGGTVTRARFTGRTSPPSHLKIDIPNGSITLTGPGGATMTVSNFSLNGDKNDWVAADTTFEILVGGRLNVGANQPAGLYTGTFDVTVTYR